jgi:prostaglandin-E synthase
LFGEVDVEGSKWNTKGRNIIFNIIKKNPDAEYWTRLTKDKTKNPHVQIDWGKWVDEDDEEVETDKGLSNDWDPSNMNAFNMGGGYGDQGGDSDDEEEEEEEPGHVHGENCDHEHEA